MRFEIVHQLDQTGLLERNSVLHRESREATYLVVNKEKDAIIYVESFICWWHF